MKFKKLADYLTALEKTSSRLKITEILADLFKKASIGEIDKICYLTLGRLAPAYAGIEFNIAEKMMIRVLARAYEEKENKIREKYKQVGDLGDVAGFFDKKEKAKALEVNQVYERLYEAAVEAGSGSVERKINMMGQLLVDLDASSVKFVTRIPLGRLRLGFSELTIMDALSWMVTSDKSKREEIETAYNVRADIGQLAQWVKQKGIEGLKQMKVSLGVPVVSALSQRLPTAEEMIKKMTTGGVKDKVAVEPKYDGTRLQVHFSRTKKWDKEEQLALDFKTQGFIRTFTRNLENSTHMFPDLAKAVFAEVRAREAILDCEAIGFDPKTNKFLPFQETIKRKRKHQIGEKAKEIPLKLFCFDILYKDGRDLLRAPFSERREILEKCLPASNKTIILSPQIITNEVKELRCYHDEQKEKGLEGVMVKKWKAPYEPGRRGYTWVKFKEEKSKKGGGLADTLDCVVMGYYKGKGRRADFGIGGFLVGIRSGESIVTLSKIGTGLSDEQWRELRKRGDQVKIHEKPKQYQVNKNLAPDVWCRPQIVVEIQADNVTVSPIHTAGLALRFPRLVRFRDDKSADQATTLAEAKKLYKMQK